MTAEKNSGLINIPSNHSVDQTVEKLKAILRGPPYGRKEELAMFKTNLAGAQVVQTVGPFRQVLTSESEKTAGGIQQRFLLVTPAESDAAELIEKTP